MNEDHVPLRGVTEDPPVNFTLQTEFDPRDRLRPPADPILVRDRGGPVDHPANPWGLLYHREPLGQLLLERSRYSDGPYPAPFGGPGGLAPQFGFVGGPSGYIGNFGPGRRIRQAVVQLQWGAAPVPPRTHPGVR